MALRSWHVGDVIRRLREQRSLTTSSLAQKAGVQRSLVLSLETQGPEIEGITPSQWLALDRVATVLRLPNGASLYKRVPEPANFDQNSDSCSNAPTASRVLKFPRK